MVRHFHTPPVTSSTDTVEWRLPARINSRHDRLKTEPKQATCPVNIQRRFNVYKTSVTLYRRLIDVETTSCVYWVRRNGIPTSEKIYITCPENVNVQGYEH